MKIVQSFWSKPGLKSVNFNCCGWPERKYNYYSWQFSALQFCRYYDEVELVTDSYGYDLLINKFELPYSKVTVVLDELNHYHEDLFVVGKLFAYQIQDKPFIHADGDIYIWGRMPEKFENSELLCQHKETGRYYNSWYANVYKEMTTHLKYIPAYIVDSVKANDNRVESINAGIIGGANINFINEYTKEAFLFIDRNIEFLNKIRVGPSNTIFEQCLFYAMAEKKGLSINLFKENFSFLGKDFADFSSVPAAVKYIHPPGAVKQERKVCSALEYNFRKEHKAFYDRTTKLLKRKFI
jgi:hypothetical protein